MVRNLRVLKTCLRKPIGMLFISIAELKRSLGSLILHPASKWGGWLEYLIGIIKGILRNVLERSSLNLKEMYTVICDIESIVNQWPFGL